MDGRVERLIDALRAACHQDSVVAARGAPASEKSFVTLAELMNVAQQEFPSADALSHEQATRLTQAILDLWKSFGIEAVYPEGFPPHLFYPLLVAKLSAFRVAHDKGVPTKTIYVEFCDYDPAHCPFGRKYCQTCWDDGVEQEMLQA